MKDMNQSGEVQLLSGNHAVAWGVKLARPDVTPVYPITPQTPILEKLTELQTQGLFDVEMITPESEHSVMATCMSAAMTGARVFTATSSQGLMLMHELLHYTAGARSSIVMFNVNRTPAAPWGFWPDQLDSLSQRDTGWVQLYSETPQESLDTVIQAFKIAETARLPVMINHDAFYVSHAVEPVNIPAQDLVDGFLPPFAPDLLLDTANGRTFGAPVNQQTWNQNRREMAEAMAEVEGLVDTAGRDWGAVTGRHYGALEQYRMDGAEVVFVTMGSLCGTVREAVDRLREGGLAAGLLKLRLFRPLPERALHEALASVPVALVLDRNYSPGMGGILHQELKAAMFGQGGELNIFGLLTGVGGVNVSVKTIEGLARKYANAAPCSEPIWVE
jgi:pyruvate/2-oxoacid:ferredoxin oxidoreductase alpha subunit